MLNKEITKEEVWNTVGSIDSFKAPGPDSFQAVFCQSQWKTVGQDMFKLVKEMFTEPWRIRELNDTSITLISKVEEVMCMKQFRPIGLCNVSYKSISKLLARRLRLFLHKLIDPAQCAFVPNRHSQDNIVVAQEIFHSMRTKKGKKGWMAIKIDLEKAYDRLKWDFVRDTLEDIGIPGNIIQLIWFCMSTSKMRLLWNGEILEEFKPERGIRQGDPISPYLFVLCIERLFQAIDLAVSNKNWKLIQVARRGPKVSHLAIADDLILFAEANQEQARIIGNTLSVLR